MPPVLIIAVIAGLIVISLIFSAISYSRQQALKKKKLRIKRYQQQADEALTYVNLLLKVDDDYDILFQLQHLIVNALTSAYSLNPEDMMIQNNLKTQQVRLMEFKEKQRSNTVTCFATTDSELASTLGHLGQLNKLLDLYRNKGDLNYAKHQELQTQITNLQHKLSYNSYLYQADVYAEQENITSYQLYLKQAIQVLKKSTLDTNTKNTKIKELSDRIQEVKRTGKVSHLNPFLKPKENKPEVTSEDETSQEEPQTDSTSS